MCFFSSDSRKQSYLHFIKLPNSTRDFSWGIGGRLAYPLYKVWFQPPFFHRIDSDICIVMKVQFPQVSGYYIVTFTKPLPSRKKRSQAAVLMRLSLSIIRRISISNHIFPFLYICRKFFAVKR